MDESQLVTLVLATLVLAMFSVNMWFSVQSYRRRRGAERLRGVVRSGILEIGVLSIFIGRVIAIWGADAEIRRFLAVLNAAAVSGALLIGGAFLVVSWIRDGDDDDRVVIG